MINCIKFYPKQIITYEPGKQERKIPDGKVTVQNIILFVSSFRVSCSGVAELFFTFLAFWGCHPLALRTTFSQLWLWIWASLRISSALHRPDAYSHRPRVLWACPAGFLRLGLFPFYIVFAFPFHTFIADPVQTSGAHERS